jgi:glycerol uptake facilitator-like aquaporin
MIIGLFFVNKIINYIIGAILGTVVAIIMVNNMYSVINKALIESEEVAEGIVRKGSIIRTVGVFVFMILVLSFKEYVNPYMTILCMFNLKFAALIQPFTNKYLIIRYVTKGR